MISVVNRRVLRALIALLVLSVILFAFVYIAAEALHDCEGEDCPVCSAVMNFVRLTSALKKIFSVAVLAVLTFAAITGTTAAIVYICHRFTLTNNNIRLNI